MMLFIEYVMVLFWEGNQKDHKAEYALGRGFDFVIDDTKMETAWTEMATANL